MEGILKEVLIKKVGNRKHDQVLIIENLPSKFIWEQTRKMVQQIDKEGYPTGNLVPDKSGELVWTLRDGIERSQTGDGGYCFSVGDQNSETILKDIMRYVDMSFPRDQRLPAFVDNAQMVGESNSGPLSYQMIPRLSLPVTAESIKPVPAPAIAPAPQEPRRESAGDLPKPKRTLSPERLEKLRNNLALARQAKKEKVPV